MRTTLFRIEIPAAMLVAALALLITGCPKKDQKLAEGAFPEGFLWGTAVAGFQVDMGCPTMPESQCTDPNSDWYVWVTDASLIADGGTHLSGDPVTMGPGHWELYDEDFERARNELGTSVFRMSIEWSRIFPVSTVGIEGHDNLAAVADATNVAHYRAMFQAMRDRGLEPYVTLHHYTIPTWMHDAVGCHFDLETCSPRGWLDRATIVNEIAKYSGFVAKEFGDLVDFWITQNEPYAVVLAGFLQPGEDRTNPPGVGLSFDAVRQSAAAMVEAHAAMYDAVHAADLLDADGDGDPAEVGLVFSVVPAWPQTPGRELDVTATQNVSYVYNWAFLDGVINGDLDEDLDGTPEHRADLAGRMDYLGINYYAVLLVEGTEGSTLPQLTPLATFNPLNLIFGYDTPKGMYDAVMMTHERYPGLPLMITENGTFVHENEYSTQFLVEHLTWLSRAIRDGADVRGYLYWSFLDNYEWNHGMGMRFGLYAVDPADPTKARVARPIADAFTRIIAGNAIPADLLDAWPVPSL